MEKIEENGIIVTIVQFSCPQVGSLLAFEIDGVAWRIVVSHCGIKRMQHVNTY